jgi:hypothetical protein
MRNSLKIIFIIIFIRRNPFFRSFLWAFSVTLWPLSSIRSRPRHDGVNLFGAPVLGSLNLVNLSLLQSNLELGVLVSSTWSFTILQHTQTCRVIAE